MRRDLRISLVQSPIVWEDRSANLSAYEKRLASVAGKTDLAVLPEMFTTGFSMAPERLADRMDGETLASVKRWAADFGMAVVGSFIAEEKGRYYNRAFLITPSGELFYYDKRHLFRMAGEDKSYAAGGKRVIVPYLGWNICLQVCYDLRFPVWSRNVNREYDLLIYVANWPEARASVWQPLLLARALENQAYVCGVNRTGTDGKGFHYRGNSVLFSPKGKKLGDAADAEEQIITCCLSAAEQEAFREKFPVWKDADDFSIFKRES